MEHTAPPARHAPYLQGVWAAGFASIWLVFPLAIGPLGLLREFWSWAVLLGIALASLRQPKPANHVVHILAWGLLVAALVNSGQGLVQAYAGWQPAARSQPTPVYGFMHQRNQFASLCLMGLCACGWLASAWPCMVQSATRRVLTLTAAAWLGAAVSLSGSRTGLLGLLLLWLVHEALATLRTESSTLSGLRWPLRAGVLGYLLALLPVLMGPGHAIGILARQDAQEGFGVCNSRLSLWANVLELIQLRPWTGWGWGALDYAHFTTLFQGKRFCELLSNAHNLPLHLAVEGGIPLAMLLCAILGWMVWRAQPWRELHPDRMLAWSVLLVIGVHSLLEYPLWYGPFQASALLGLWILAGTPRQTGSDLDADHRTLPPAAARALQATAAGALLCTALVAADYYRASQIYLPPTQRLGMYRENTQEQIQRSLFFQGVIDFAQLGLTDVTAQNASAMHDLAQAMLHFSPEAMVVQKLLTAARLLGRQDEYDYYQQRFAAAYPDAYRQWKASQPGD